MTKVIAKILAAAAIALTSPAVSAQTHSVKAELDSAYLLMGKQTLLKLEVVEDINSSGAFAFKGDTIIKEVEIIAAAVPDTVDLGNNRRQINHNILIQSFDSGLYTLPPIPYISANGDTAFTQPLTLKVIPVPVDSLATIHGYADTADGGSRWYDFLPDWITDYWAWFVIGLIIVAGGIVALLMYTGKAKKVLVPQKKPVPPYEQAIARLNALRERHLCENGQEREFYTSLTEILREYLERQFGINAMEMTSSQIVTALQGREETRVPNALMRQILQIADFVKFAKARPLPDDNMKAFNSAMKFVEDTRPQPIFEPNDNTDSQSEPNQQ